MRRGAARVLLFGAAVSPRDLLDQTKDALGWPDVRLEFEDFDRRFRVETEDARFATAFLDQRMVEALLRLPDDVIADVGETLLLWAPELPPAQVLRLLYAAIAIRRRIPRVLANLFPPRPTRGA